MRSVQVSKPKGPLEIVEKILHSPALDKYVSRYKHVVYAIVIPLLKKDYSQASNIQGFLAMRLQEL
jgi:hypothetical protein